MPIVAPLAGIVITYISNVIFQFLNEQKDKKFLKDTFGTYISPGLIDKMHEEQQAPKLGGVQDYHTAFFSDIQDFSTFSEVLDPERLVRLMNEYLTAMTDVLLAHEGTLDKYIGDAIVAFYGAPAPVADHEKKACATALAMRMRLKELREKWKKEDDWPDIVYSMRHRIGLNCGSMVTGNMGSTQRMNYTMMGDTVNLAARLESSAKQYGVYIQISENTYNAAKDRLTVRELDTVIVVGKTEPVKTYELIAEKDQESALYKELLPKFHDALELYKKQQWDQAFTAFGSIEKLEEIFPGRKTNPSRVYMDRCTHLKENPPGDDWDGVWTLTSKK